MTDSIKSARGFVRIVLVAALSFCACVVAPAVLAALPSPTSAQYCSAVQQLLANTTAVAKNTVFKDMPSFRHSKPGINPLQIYQVVTYSGAIPIVVSCKVKTAAHLRAAYGPKAAGVQLNCWNIVQLTQDAAIAALRREGNTAAAARASVFKVDHVEPYITGRAYLADFQSIYRSDDGIVHLNSPGLFQDYDSWITYLLPSALQGQSYCHLPTLDYVKAVASGTMAPGATITTNDDAPVQAR